MQNSSSNRLNPKQITTDATDEINSLYINTHGQENRYKELSCAGERGNILGVLKNNMNEFYKGV